MPRPLRLAPFLLLALALAACDSGGDGMVTATSTVTVAYEGRLAADDSVFDSSPRATFPLRDVIPGFRDGMLGMVVGETRTFTVPPEQGYGAAGRPPRVPPNATLIFEVTLLGLQ